MFRNDHATAVAVLPAAGAVGTPGYFTKGDPLGGVPATVPTADWANALQEEVCGVIEGQGLVLSKTDRTQLRQAITKMIQAGQRAVVIDSATINAGVATGHAVYWDSANARFDKALADGTAKQNCVGFADVANSKIYAFGDAVLFAGYGLTPGARYYLDGAVAGGITTVPPTNSVFVGIAKGATEMFVDVDSAAGGVQVNQNNNWTKAQRGAVSAIAYAATMTPDFSASNNYSVTLTGNGTLATPTNLVEGQSGIITIKQDATGSRTLAYGAGWKFVGGVVPSLTTTANATDELVYYVNPGSATVFAILNKDIR